MGWVGGLHGKRVYLDANVFIYALSGFPAFAPGLTELFDAIHAATSQLAGCDAFVTNDQRFKAVSGVSLVLLSEVTSA